MIAKLIVWGENRDAALVQMRHALSQFHVEGLGNNIAFLDRLVACDSFKNAHLDTNLIQREDDFLFQQKSEVEPETIIAAAFIELLSRLDETAHTIQSVWQTKPIWRSNIQSQYSIKFKQDDQDIFVKFTANEQNFTAEFNGEQFPISGKLLNKNLISIQSKTQKDKFSFSRSSTLFDFEETFHHTSPFPYCIHYSKVSPIFNRFPPHFGLGKQLPEVYSGNCGGSWGDFVQSFPSET